MTKVLIGKLKTKELVRRRTNQGIKKEVTEEAKANIISCDDNAMYFFSVAKATLEVQMSVRSLVCQSVCPQNPKTA